MAQQSRNADSDLAVAAWSEQEWRAGLPFLIAQARAGEDEAWEAIYRHYQVLVYGVCLDWMHDHDEAADHASTTWERVMRAINTFDPDTNFTAWICTIAANACRDTFKAPRVRRRVWQRPDEHWRAIFGDESGSSGMSTASVVEARPDPAPGPEALALKAEERREARAVLARGLRALPAGCAAIAAASLAAGRSASRYNVRPAVARQALAAEFAYGVDRPTGGSVFGGARSGAVAAVAAASGIGFSAAKSRLYRARLALRLAVELTGGWDGGVA